MTAAVELHPARMIVGPDGIKDFYWPVRLSEIPAARDVLVEKLRRWLGGTDLGSHHDSAVVWLAIPQLLTEFIGLAELVMLVRRGRAAGRDVALAEAALRDVADGTKASAAVALWRDRPLATPRWRLAARFAYSALHPGRARYQSRWTVRNGDSMTFQANAFVQRWCRSQNINSRLGLYVEWFRPGCDADFDAVPELQPDVLARLEQYASEALEVCGETLDAVGRRYWRNVCVGLARQVAYRISELAAWRLPGRHLANSGGHMLSRIFAHAVRQQGGEVVSFDHGTSSALWDSSMLSVLEAPYADRFVTFGETTAALHRENIRTFPGLGANLEVEWLPAERADAAVHRPVARPRPRSIMYVATVYSGGISHYLPLLSAPVAVDWQARLFSFLREKGWNLAVKPHPESPFDFTDALLALGNATILHEPFEEVADRAEVLLFDYPQTTAFREALHGDRGIVVFEVPRLAIKPKVKAMLAERCVFVPVQEDESGRLQVDFKMLADAIEESKCRVDRSGAQALFPRPGEVATVPAQAAMVS